MDQHSTERIYPELPPPALREEFRAYLEATQEPETFAGLAWSKPDLKSSVTIDEFVVGKNRRDDDRRVPCSVCGIPKFFAGAFIWSEDGRIRLVGHQCAESADRDAYQRMRNDHLRREEAAWNERFLEENLPKVAQYADEAAALTPVCHALSEHKKIFKSQLRPLVDLMLRSKKTEGNLYANEAVAAEVTREVFKRRQAVEYRRTVVHKLEGLTLFDPGFDPEGERATVESYFRNQIEPTEYDYFSRVAEATANDSVLARLVANHKAYTSRLLALRKRIDEAMRFYLIGNFSGLKKYGMHPHGELPFQMSWDRSGLYISLPRKLPVKLPFDGAIGPAVSPP